MSAIQSYLTDLPAEIIAMVIRYLESGDIVNLIDAYSRLIRIAAVKEHCEQLLIPVNVSRLRKRPYPIPLILNINAGPSDRLEYHRNRVRMIFITDLSTPEAVNAAFKLCERVKMIKSMRYNHPVTFLHTSPEILTHNLAGNATHNLAENICRLANIVHLDVWYNDFITGAIISQLKRLTYLRVVKCIEVARGFLRHLTKLESFAYHPIIKSPDHGPGSDASIIFDKADFKRIKSLKYFELMGAPVLNSCDIIDILNSVERVIIGPYAHISGRLTHLKPKVSPYFLIKKSRGVKSLLLIRNRTDIHEAISSVRDYADLLGITVIKLAPDDPAQVAEAISDL